MDVINEGAGISSIKRDSMYELISTIDSVIRPLIPMFLEQSLLRIQGLDEALNGSDFGTIKKIAHTMKGSCSSYGFNAMAECALKIEELLSSANTDRQAIAAQISLLTEIHDEALAVVSAHPNLFQDS